MSAFMVEPEKSGVPTFCIWRCWCGETSEPTSWIGRWSAYKEARSNWYDHIRKDHYKGRVWLGINVTVDDLEPQRASGKRTIRIKKRRGRW